MMAKRRNIQGKTLESEMLDAIKELDGIEVHRDNWVVAERLVKKGLIDFGPARGPGGDFRRATLKETADEDD